jgi:beta-1,4-mannosyltransferase
LRRIAGPRSAIACLSKAPFNPYLELLYAHLAAEGIPAEPGGSLTVRWLAGPPRRRVRWLHVHWPESLYRLQRGPAALRGPLSWLKLVAFSGRLALARVLGYRIVWTIHQPLPHERAGALDVSAARALARLAHLLVAHDQETAREAARVLGPVAARVEIVPHGSFVGVYPRGRGRDAERVDLGAPAGTRIALCFGELRGYKDVDLLLDAFGRVEADAMLVVSGKVKDEQVGETVRRAAARDDRVRLIPGFVPAERVDDLFAAADIAVLPRGDGGTSGSLILALSQCVPVVAADRPAYRVLLAEGEAGWLFAPGDSDSLAGALEAAFAATDDELARRGRAATAQADTLDWASSARRLAALLRDLVRQEPPD